MFKKIIGKTCKNPDCSEKDKIREEYSVMCDCGQTLEEITAIDKAKIAITGVATTASLIVGVYLIIMQIKGAATEVATSAVSSAVSTAVTEGGKIITDAMNKPQTTGDSVKDAAKEVAASVASSVVSTAMTEGGKIISEAMNKPQTAGVPASDPARNIEELKSAMVLVSDALKLVKENKLQDAVDKFSQAAMKDQNNDQAWGN